LNLPDNIGTVSYLYSASGNKLKKTFGTSETTYYQGSVLIINDNPVVLNPDGRAVWNSSTSKWEYEYDVKDHLGNTRASFGITDKVKVLQTRDYYPFGLEMANWYTNDPNATKFRYNGKELQDEEVAGSSLGWYDYGARFYDPGLGRFNTQDPHAENYISWTPYNYVANNPILLIDPDGRDWYDINGNITWFDQTGDLNIDDQTYQSLGANVLVSYHMRDENGNEDINSAWHALYLETDTDGPTAIIEGNTVPADIETMNTLAEGLYPAESDSRRRYPNEMAFRINNAVSTTGVAMTGVFFHRGNTHRPSLTTNPDTETGRVDHISTGCITGPSGAGSAARFNSFMENSRNFNINYYLRSNRLRR
jgi:RHS repeat-associated protein